MKTEKGRTRGESIYQEKMSTRQGTRTSRIPMTTQETRLKKQDRAGRACYLPNNSLVHVNIYYNMRVDRPILLYAFNHVRKTSNYFINVTRYFLHASIFYICPDYVNNVLQFENEHKCVCLCVCMCVCVCVHVCVGIFC